MQAIQDAFLDGEFEILHFVVMRFQPVVQRHQLAVNLRHFLFHLGNGLGRADTRHHVLALGIDQIFAVDQVLAGAGVAGEAHAGAGIVAHVAEYHGADVDCRAAGLILGDPELPAVIHRALAHPRAEHSAYRNFQLLVRVLREGFAAMTFHDGEELFRQFLEVVDVQIQILRRAVFALDRGHAFVKMFVADVERDLAEQLDETAIGIVGKALVAGLLDQAFAAKFR